VAALLAGGWLAASAQASEIGLRFASKQPGTGTAMALHIRYTKTGDPNAKPSPIRKLQIDAPAGTVFHSATVPACKASDAEVMLLGTSACPRASRIGGGPIVVVTGFGKPFDPFVSPTPTFNDGSGWLEISQTPSDPPVTIAVTRGTITGSRISETIAPAPGGPPDYQSAVSTVDLSFPASTGYITTPATCPASGRWVTTGTFTFADGTTQTARGDTPCITTQPARIRVRLRPKRVRAGRRARIRVALRSKDPRCISRALVRLRGHHSRRSDRSGRATIVARFRRPGRRKLTASKRGCRAGAASLTVLRPRQIERKTGGR
jgi:hypothetical protein